MSIYINHTTASPVTTAQDGFSKQTNYSPKILKMNFWATLDYIWIINKLLFLVLPTQQCEVKLLYHSSNVAPLAFLFLLPRRDHENPEF